MYEPSSDEPGAPDATGTRGYRIGPWPPRAAPDAHPTPSAEAPARPRTGGHAAPEPDEPAAYERSWSWLGEPAGRAATHTFPIPSEHPPSGGHTAPSTGLPEAGGWAPTAWRADTAAGPWGGSASNETPAEAFRPVGPPRAGRHGLPDTTPESVSGGPVGWNPPGNSPVLGHTPQPVAATGESPPHRRARHAQPDSTDTDDDLVAGQPESDSAWLGQAFPHRHAERAGVTEPAGSEPAGAGSAGSGAAGSEPTSDAGAGGRHGQQAPDGSRDSRADDRSWAWRSPDAAPGSGWRPEPPAEPHVSPPLARPPEPSLSDDATMILAGPDDPTGPQHTVPAEHPVPARHAGPAEHAVSAEQTGPAGHVGPTGRPAPAAQATDHMVAAGAATRSTEPAGPQASRLDAEGVLAAVRDVPGLRSAYLATDEGGNPTLRLDVADDHDSEPAIAAARQALRARFGEQAGLAVAAGSAQQAPTVEPGPLVVANQLSGTGREPRAVVERVQVATAGAECAVEVCLTVNGTRAVGRAGGPALDTHLLRVAALATADAVDTLAGGRVRCAVEHVDVVTAGPCRVVLVIIVLMGGAAAERLAGSAVVGDDERHATVRATMDALNRRLAPLLPR